MNVGIRYAKALFELAEQHGTIDRFMQELSEIRELFSGNEELGGIFYNRLIDRTRKIKVLSDVYDRLYLSKEVKNLLVLLIDGGREKSLGDVVAAYEQMSYDYKGLVKAEVYSAYDITPEEMDALKAKIKALFNREPVLSVNRDSSVIGGIKLKVGWTVYDGTIRTNLMGFMGSIKV
ncbi:MAG: ATP synthase F1 subunit delta [Deltaproteobacteria bacterium]|nr:ATP synthase F1 subunit delta [Deltaproteobacteria bacterium]MCL5276554.1 ATP synthase F1 subunit delta [Deltaproteobacteria bacterium]